MNHKIVYLQHFVSLKSFVFFNFDKVGLKDDFTKTILQLEQGPKRAWSLPRRSLMANDIDLVTIVILTGFISLIKT